MAIGLDSQCARDSGPNAKGPHRARADRAHAAAAPDHSVSARSAAAANGNRSTARGGSGRADHRRAGHTDSDGGPAPSPARGSPRQWSPRATGPSGTATAGSSGTRSHERPHRGATSAESTDREDVTACLPGGCTPGWRERERPHPCAGEPGRAGGRRRDRGAHGDGPSGPTGDRLVSPLRPGCRHAGCRPAPPLPSSARCRPAGPVLHDGYRSLHVVGVRRQAWTGLASSCRAGGMNT